MSGMVQGIIHNFFEDSLPGGRRGRVCSGSLASEDFGGMPSECAGAILHVSCTDEGDGPFVSHHRKTEGADRRSTPLERGGGNLAIKKGATCQRAVKEVVAVPRKSVSPTKLYCTYTGCDRPDHSSRFHKVEAGQSAGGRNWDPLAASVLCHACYCQYLKRGTLERTKNKPIAADRRRCTLIGCNKPEYGSSFYQIEPHKTAGGWDWSRLTGNVLCSACYQRFLRSGTLKNKVRPASRAEISAMEGRISPGDSDGDAHADCGRLPMPPAKLTSKCAIKVKREDGVAHVRAQKRMKVCNEAAHDVAFAALDILCAVALM